VAAADGGELARDEMPGGAVRCFLDQRGMMPLLDRPAQPLRLPTSEAPMLPFRSLLLLRPCRSSECGGIDPLRAGCPELPTISLPFLRPRALVSSRVGRGQRVGQHRFVRVLDGGARCWEGRVARSASALVRQFVQYGSFDDGRTTGNQRRRWSWARSPPSDGRRRRQTTSCGA
jgi:hypothetical protein